jgi:hypothetical protein
LLAARLAQKSSQRLPTSGIPDAQTARVGSYGPFGRTFTFADLDGYQVTLHDRGRAIAAWTTAGRESSLQNEQRSASRSPTNSGSGGRRRRRRVVVAATADPVLGLAQTATVAGHPGTLFSSLKYPLRKSSAIANRSSFGAFRPFAQLINR